jgi:hypothetical protein
MADGTGHDHGDLERRVARLEAWADARMVTKDFLEAHLRGIEQRLLKGEENDTWLMRLIVITAVGTIVNGAMFLLR